MFSGQLAAVNVLTSIQDWSILDKQSKTVGFRSVKLVQEPLAEADVHGKGTTFLFEVNNVRMFMGGMTPTRVWFCLMYTKLESILLSTSRLELGSRG